MRQDAIVIAGVILWLVVWQDGRQVNMFVQLTRFIDAFWSRRIGATYLASLSCALAFSLVFVPGPTYAEKLPFNGKTMASSKSVIKITPLQYGDAMFKKHVQLSLEQISKLKIESGYRVTKLNIITLDKAQNASIDTIRNSAIVMDVNTIEVPHPLLGPYIDHSKPWKEYSAASKWYYLKKDGKPLVADRFSYAFDFEGGLGIVDDSKPEEKDKCNLRVIDKSGKEITAKIAALKDFGKKFFFVGAFHEGLAPVKEVSGKKYQFINNKFSPAFARKFDGVSEEQTGLYGKLTPVKEEEFWGYVNGAGAMLIKPRFAQAKQFHNGVAAIKLFDFEIKQVRRSSTDAEWTLLNSKGKRLNQVFDGLRSFEEPVAESGPLAVVTTRPMQGRPRRQLINAKGAIVGKTFDEIGDVSEGLVPVCLNGLAGFADLNGQIVIAPAYRAAGAFSEGLAPVVVAGAEGDNVGFIDHSGKLVIPAKFPIEEGYYVILPKQLYRFSEGLAVVPRDGLFGYIDKTGAWKIPPAFVSARPFHEGFAAVQRR